MNIFYVDSDPRVCAMQHVDKHVVKMILEYSQLLSTAHRVLDGSLVVGLSPTGRKSTSYVLDGPQQALFYKATHINHPSAVWVRTASENYIWLHQLLVELCKEYTHRYGRTHKCEAIGLVAKLATLPAALPRGSFSPPTAAMPDEFKLSDRISAYRAYYRGAKSHMFSWKNREIPTWAV